VGQSLEEGAGDGELPRNRLPSAVVDVPEAGLLIADDGAPFREVLGVLESRSNDIVTCVVDIAEQALLGCAGEPV